MPIERARSTRTVAGLRFLLLGVFVLALGGLGALYWFGRNEQPLERTPPRPDASDPGGAIKALAEGFRFQLEDGGRTLFAIQSRGYQLDDEGRVLIDGMGVEVFAVGGDTYLIESDKAVFDRETNEAQLQDGARVRGPAGIELESPTLELAQKGNLIRTDTKVSFRYGSLAKGTADRLRLNLAEKLYLFAGSVWIENGDASAAPFSLASRRILVDRVRHNVRAEKGVEARYANHRLRARQANLWLAEDDKTPIFFRAKHEVRGHLGSQASAAELGPVRFAGRRLSVYFEPGTRNLARLELAGRPIEPAFLISSPVAQPPRRLLAGLVLGTFTGGALTQAEATGGVRLAELRRAPPDESWTQVPLGPDDEDAAQEDPAAEEVEDDTAIEPVDVTLAPFDAYERDALRVAVAPRAQLTMTPEGELSEVVLLDKVELREPRYTARGTQARFDYANGLGEFVGLPAEVVSPRGRMTAPRFLYTERSGLLYASGGTRSRLERGGESGNAFTAGPLGEGEGPIWVESVEAFFRDPDRTFLFRGGVKAWRGENLLRADELQGEERTGKLTAKGKVSTVWQPAPRPTTGPPPLPAETTSDVFLYQKNGERIRYEGNVRSKQGDRNLASDVMEVELDANRKAKAVVLEGNVRIEDPATGRSVTGDWARYDLGSKTVEVEGQKVVVKEKDGAEVSGRRVVYELGSEKLEVGGTPQRLPQPAPPAATPTPPPGQP
jgi:lipopolysaccharide transport protein LptA